MREGEEKKKTGKDRSRGLTDAHIVSQSSSESRRGGEPTFEDIEGARVEFMLDRGERDKTRRGGEVDGGKSIRPYAIFLEVVF
jgi:hypothetical protein